MAANNNSPQSPPLKEQVPQEMRIGIEILPDLDMQEPELSPSPVAGKPGSDFLAVLSSWRWCTRNLGQKI